MTRRRGGGLRTVSVLLALCLIAVACSGGGSDDETGTGAARTAGTGAPLLDIGSDTTWRDLVETVAGGDEAECADSAYEDDGLDSLLDTPVRGPGGFEGWPLVGTELLGIGIGGGRWPHESWQCLSDRNASAVYLSAFVQEQGLDVTAMTDGDRECISQLPHDVLLSGTAARVLKSEHEFGGPDVSEFFHELDEVAVSRVVWCVSDLAGKVLEFWIDNFYGGELNEADLRCMTDAALDAAREPDVDRDELYVALTSDDFIPDGTESGAIVAILGAGADACLSEDDGADLADEVDEVGPAEGADQDDGADPAEEAGETAGITAVAVWEGTVDFTWADLFDRFPDAEWSCFLEAFDNDEEIITWFLEGPISLIFEVSEWIEGVFGCLGRESAAYASVAMIADDLALARGLALDPAAGECLRAAFVELDMATVWHLYDNPEDLDRELAESLDAALWRCLPDQGSEGLSGDTADPQATQVWETAINSTGSPVAVVPTVIDNVVLASDYSGGVWALDSAGGELLWVFDHGGQISVPPSGAETVVLVSGGSMHFALDARTGSVQWQWPRSGSTLGKPAFAAGVVFINETGSSFSSTVTAIDLAMGTPVWTSEVRTSELPLLFPLAVAGDRVLVSDDTTMHALDIATGAAVWSAGVSPGAQVVFSSGTVAAMGGLDPAEVDDAPTTVPTSCLRGSATGYCVIARDAATGAWLWYWELAEDVVGHAAMPGRADGAFLITGDGLHAVDARSGELFWSVPVSLLLGAPFAAGGSIFVVGLSEGLMALDAATGAQRWALAVEGSGPMALEDGVLYLGSSQQEVHAIDAQLGELLWTSPAFFADGDQRAFAIHHGSVFVGFQGSETGGVRSLAAPAGESTELPGEGVDVIAGRANWFSGYFQAALYRQLLEELGYNVSDPAELELPPSLGYLAMAEGDMDYWPNSWYPLHLRWLVEELSDGTQVGEHLTIVGEEMIEGGLQGFLVTKAFADEYGVYTMDELNSKAEALAAFDATDPVPGNGMADIFGCPESWSCHSVIEDQIASGGWDNIAQLSLDYYAMFAQAAGYVAGGTPMVLYMWTPSDFITRLGPGQDVYWMGVDDIIDSERGVDGSGGYAAIGSRECPSAAYTGDGRCPIGWAVDDILVTARNEFLDANPAAETLFELVKIPMIDVSLAVAAQEEGADPASLAAEWIAGNRGLVDKWIAAARAAD